MELTDPLVAAIAENALWCDRVAHAVGARTEVDGRRWWSASRMPPLHPDAVTIAPGLDLAAVLDGLDLGPGCSVKDSHSDVDLGPAGFSIVISGRWWHRPPGPVTAGPVRATVTALEDEVVDGLLGDDPEIRSVVARDADGAAVGRAVLHQADAVVGVSNVVAEPGREVDTWQAVVGAAAGRHLVGWEAEDVLAPVVALGGRALGPLRVWQRPVGPAAG